MFNVLVVDDSSIDLILLSDIIKSTLTFENTVTTFTESEQALIQYTNNDYDIVITDIEMPGLDGFEFIEKIKLQKKHSTVIAVSGSKAADNANETILYAANCFGADYAVSKTRLYDDLSTLLAKLCNHQAA